MQKRIFSLTLVLMMILSQTTFAAVSNDESTKKIIYTDNFDNEQPRRINSREETSYTSDVFDCPVVVNKGLIGYGYSNIAENEGPDNSNAVIFEKRVQSRFIVTRQLEITDQNEKAYEFSYDVKLSDNLNQVALGCDAVRIERSTLFSLNPGGLIKTSTDGKTLTDNPNMTYEPDKWYHILIHIQGNTKHGWMYDDDGNCIYSMRNDFTQKRISPFFIDTAYAKHLEKLTLDNAKIVEYIPGETAPTVVVEPSVSKNDCVRTDTPYTTVTFDTLIDSESTALLISDDNSETACRMVLEPSKPYTYRILFPPLAADKAYALDLSTVKSSGGKNVENNATYNFSTVASPVKIISNTKTSDDAISGTAVYTGFNKSDTINVSLRAEKALSADIVVLYYDSLNKDKLIHAKTVSCFVKKGSSRHTITLDQSIDADYAMVLVCV